MNHTRMCCDWKTIGFVGYSYMRLLQSGCNCLMDYFPLTVHLQNVSFLT